MIKIFLLAIVFSAVYACSGFEDEAEMPADVYQGYRFEYDEADNETNIGAVFRAGSEKGEVVKLSSPALLKVNDEICEYDDSNADYPYQLTFKSRLPEALINFIDFKKQEFINKIELDSLVQVKDFTIAIDSAAHVVSLSLTGEERCPHEIIQLVVMASGVEVVYDVTEGEDNTIVVSDDILNSFAGQLVSVKLLRIKIIDLSDVSAAGGSAQLVYSSKIKEVRL